MPTPKLLILSGTREGFELAHHAHQVFGNRLEIISSLAGVTGHHPDLPGQVRVGGFGGSHGLGIYLQSEKINMVVDATHPFAEKISAAAYGACLVEEVPRLALVRPAWQFSFGDRWHEVADLDACVAALDPETKRAFLTIGIKELAAFAEFEETHFLVRLMNEPKEPLPLKNATVLIERPPFDVEHERKILRDHRIQVLITKNSGGAATGAKIIAAREEKIPVLIIERPPEEPGEQVETVKEALRWIESHLGQTGNL